MPAPPQVLSPPSNPQNPQNDKFEDKLCTICKRSFFYPSATFKENCDRINSQKLTLCKLYSVQPYSPFYQNFLRNDSLIFCFNCSEKIVRIQGIYDQLDAAKEELGIAFKSTSAEDQLGNTNLINQLFFKGKKNQVEKSVNTCSDIQATNGGTASISEPSTSSSGIKAPPPSKPKVKHEVKREEEEEEDVITLSDSPYFPIPQTPQTPSMDIQPKSAISESEMSETPLPTPAASMLASSVESQESQDSSEYHESESEIFLMLIDAEVSQIQSVDPNPEPQIQPTLFQNLQTFFEQSNDPLIIRKEYFNPNWLFDTSPKASPYVPQIGDELIYFRQGHELYLEKFRKILPRLEMKSMNGFDNPCVNKAELPVTVSDISYEVAPLKIPGHDDILFRFACVELTYKFREPGKKEEEERTLTFKYHDMPYIYDFMVLRNVYDVYVRNKWFVGDRFRYFVNGSWYIGEIVSKTPFQSKYPKSHFLCYKTKYWRFEGSAPGSSELMSPWEMEIIPAEFELKIKSYTGKEGIPSFLASAKDIELRKKHCWKPQISKEDSDEEEDEDHEAMLTCQRIYSHLPKVLELDISLLFRHAVSRELYPDYEKRIAYPIDLSRIQNRLKNIYYRHNSAILHDFGYIAKNAAQYNNGGHPYERQIIKNANKIKDICVAIVEDDSIDQTNVKKLWKKLISDISDYSEDSDESDAESIQRKRRRSSSKDKSEASNKRKKSGEPAQVKWVEECRNMLREIKSSKFAEPFLAPVDLLQFRDYTRIIDTPMDLLTISEELDGGNYRTPNDFIADFNLIISNSRKYNQDKESTIYSMTTRLKAHFDEKIKAIMDIYYGEKRKSKDKK